MVVMYELYEDTGRWLDGISTIFGYTCCDGKRSIAGTYPYYPNFAIITSTSWKIRAKNPNIREVDYGNTPCYSGKAACDLDRDYSGM